MTMVAEQERSQELPERWSAKAEVEVRRALTRKAA